MPEIPQEMLAAVIERHGAKFKWQKVQVPELGPTECLVKLARSGICHTDVHAVDGDWPAASKLPLIPGHEGVGTVVKVGEEVEHVQVNDRVGVPWLGSACGFCEFCVSGRENLCPSQQNSGYSRDGCFAEYVVAAAGYVDHIPESLSFDQAGPMTCAGVTVYAAIKAANIRPGHFLTIIGAGGGLGHLATQFAVAMGCRVVGLDVGQDKIDFIKRLGAEYACEAKDADLVDKVSKLTGGGAHGVLCLAASLGAFKNAVALCRRGGTVVMVGLPKGELPLSVVDVVLRGITIKGSIVGTREDMREALDFAARGLVKCSVETHSFSDLNDIFDKVRAGKVLGRAVLNMEAVNNREK